MSTRMLVLLHFSFILFYFIYLLFVLKLNKKKMAVRLRSARNWIQTWRNQDFLQRWYTQRRSLVFSVGVLQGTGV